MPTVVKSVVAVAILAVVGVVLGQVLDIFGPRDFLQNPKHWVDLLLRRDDDPSDVDDAGTFHRPEDHVRRGTPRRHLVGRDERIDHPAVLERPDAPAHPIEHHVGDVAGETGRQGDLEAGGAVDGHARA